MSRSGALLVLDEEFPYPLNNGKRTRSFNLYTRLARDFRIRYVGFGAQDSDAARVLREHGIETIAVPDGVAPKHGVVFYLRLVANLASPLPYIVTSHRSRAYKKAVGRCLQEGGAEVVVAEWTPYAIYARHARARKLLVAHNVEADIWRRYYENASHALQRWYIREQRRKVRRFESMALSWMDGATAVSELDRERLALESPRLRIEVVPNGVDLGYFALLPPRTSGSRLVFTGSMDWRPNQDAARHFVRDIFPLIRRIDPGVECTFVGRNPPDDILRLREVPGVYVTGTVEDVRPFVERASVYVVPLRIGGGSRLKILEAMAMGRAIVSTRVGAEGLSVVDGRHLLLADSSESFADAVLALLGDAERRQSLLEAGRRLVEEQYGWDNLASRFAAFIDTIAHKPLEGSGPSAMDPHVNAMSN